MLESPEKTLNALFTDEGRLQTWLDIEAALADCQAEMGMLPKEAAADIASKAHLSCLDMSRYEQMYAETKHPLVPLLKLFQSAIGANGEYVHMGATTHDIVDIAKMISLKKTWEITEQVLLDIEADLLDLIERHSGTLMAGRSHNIQSLPITFGLKATVWASELRRNIERLRASKDRIFVITFCGANGTYASLGGRGRELERRLAEKFGLGVPDVPWHAARDRIAEMASIFAIIGGSMARIAQEVYMLMASEIGELSEGYREGLIGSSTLPQKLNPINSQHVLGAARTLRYDAAHCAECMLIDHEHNLVHFNDERTTIERMGRTMGELLERSQELIHTLYVDTAHMRRNLNALRGAILAENVMLALGRKIGKMTAKDIVGELAVRAVREEIDLHTLLKADARVRPHLSDGEIDALLSPEQYIGESEEIALEYVRHTRALRAAERSARTEG